VARRFWRTPLNPGGPRTPPGEVHVIAERCKGCGFCVEFCPRGVLRESAGFNRRGYRFPEAVHQPECAECHFCELLCPEFAIYVTRPAPATAAAPGSNGSKTREASRA
jgi:2-oxoglutarate ferredoxin oxidoreductase subunit delta